MTLNIEEEYALDLGVDYEGTARLVIDRVLESEKCPYEAEVNLLLVSDEEIHRMNLEFRDVDRPTDVLSFPMIDFAVPGNFDGLEEREDCFDPETGELSLGDIVISKEKVLSQAEAYGHSVLREYAFLIVHSVLHLTGYDHMEPSERSVMEEQQRRIMEALNISR